MSIMAGQLAELLYPLNARCFGCEDWSGADRYGLCRSCVDALERIRIGSDADRCPCCMQPLDRRGLCERCAPMRGWIRRAGYAFPYRAPASNIVRAFKYAGIGVLAEWMARQMADMPGAERLLRGCDLIVCVPMDLLRRNRRGYNQAWLLARELSRIAGIPAADVLRRRPFVRHQAGLKREQRLENLKGAIRCAEDVSGKRILLVDDVRTTGATAAACAEALRKAGAMQVDLMTFAGAE